MMTSFLLVGAGGFAGAAMRFAAGKWLNKGKAFPMGTIAVNLLGSFLLGILTGARRDEMAALFFGTGFLGAFTTFSTLNLESIQLFQHGMKKEFLLYLFITYAGGIALAGLGYLLGMRLL